MYEDFHLNSTGQKKMEKIKAQMAKIAILVTKDLPHCREASLFETHMEQACMWAVRAMSTIPSNHDSVTKRNEKNLKDVSLEPEPVKKKVKKKSK